MLDPPREEEGKPELFELHVGVRFPLFARFGQDSVYFCSIANGAFFGCRQTQQAHLTGKTTRNRRCLLMACIGEDFEIPDVVGCVVSTRFKDDILSVWNLQNSNHQVCVAGCHTRLVQAANRN